ncbi:MAG: proline--tRNA ligase, partial [bacterium]|nr:proline--tRNA ligase [bacterium]
MIFYASKYPLLTSKQAPKDFDTKSAKYLYRSGFIRKVSSGIYTFLPLAKRVIEKVERIVKDELDKIGFELILPVVQPDVLWKRTGRWFRYGEELLRFKDRKGAEFCIAPTAEELITWIFSTELSYKDLPKLFYQIGVKFRDELRPRFGIQRAREFIMKDAYSFHASTRELDEFYDLVLNTYKNIFNRIGLEYDIIEASTGAIGGSVSHEFVVKENTNDFSGEALYVVCSLCGYKANIEVAVFEPKRSDEELLDLVEVYTPGLTT